MPANVYNMVLSTKLLNNYSGIIFIWVLIGGNFILLLIGFDLVVDTNFSLFKTTFDLGLLGNFIFFKTTPAFGLGGKFILLKTTPTFGLGGNFILLNKSLAFGLDNLINPYFDVSVLTYGIIGIFLLFKEVKNQKRN